MPPSTFFIGRGKARAFQSFVFCFLFLSIRSASLFRSPVRALVSDDWVSPTQRTPDMPVLPPVHAYLRDGQLCP